MALQLGWALSRTPGSRPAWPTIAPPLRRCRTSGVKLFQRRRRRLRRYMFAFEVTSILIIIAMVGAVVIARKRED
jgi:hypothetical protein